MTRSSPDATERYLSGFGNEFATEAVAGRAAGGPELAAAGCRSASMPSRSRARPSPRRAPRTAAPGSIASGRRRCIRPFAGIDDGLLRSAPFDEVDAAAQPPALGPAAVAGRSRPISSTGSSPWAAMAMPRRGAGIAIHVYRANRSMARPRLLRRRRRAADRAAAGPAAARHRARRARRSRRARSR